MEKNFLTQAFEKKTKLYWINVFCFLLLVFALLFDNRDRFLDGVMQGINDFIGK